MRIFISLTKEEFEALREIARRERRRPVDQAAHFVAECIATTQKTTAQCEVFSEEDLAAAFGDKNDPDPANEADAQ